MTANPIHHTVPSSQSPQNDVMAVVQKLHTATTMRSYKCIAENNVQQCFLTLKNFVEYGLKLFSEISETCFQKNKYWLH